MASSPPTHNPTPPNCQPPPTQYPTPNPTPPPPYPHYSPTHTTVPASRIHSLQRPCLFHLRQRCHRHPPTLQRLRLFSSTTSPIQTPLQNPVSKLPTRPTSTLSPPVYYIFPTRISHSPHTSLTMPIYPATCSALPPSSTWDTPPPTPVTASPSPTAAFAR